MRSRIRTIKPEAFLDEELWDLEVETGLPIFRGFVGLWCYADREGRFEWRPRALKTLILPYWDGDFSRVLHACTTRGFVVKYASGTREYGLVRTFTRHQVINNRETPSTLPAPDERLVIAAASTRAPRVPDACPTRQVQDKAEREREREREREGSVDMGGTSPPAHPELELDHPPPEPTATPVELVFEAFVEHHIQARHRGRAKLNGDRRARIQARLNEGYEAARLIAAIRGALADPWIMGVDPKSPRPYRDLAQILRDGSQVERLEQLDGQPRATREHTGPPEPDDFSDLEPAAGGG